MFATVGLVELSEELCTDLSWCYDGCIYGHYDHCMAIRWVQFAIFWPNKEIMFFRTTSDPRNFSWEAQPKLSHLSLWCSRPQGLIQPQKVASMRDLPTNAWSTPAGFLPPKETVSGFQNTLAPPPLKFFNKWRAKEGFWPRPCRYFSACANSFTELEQIPHAGCEGGESLRWKMAP